MNFPIIMGIVATILGIYSTVPYVIAVVKGKTKPHQLSWLVFVIMNGIVFLSQYLAGGRESVLITLTFFVGSLIIFLLSLKYGTRNTSRWDKALFTFALATIIVWILTRSNETAIWLTLVIDLAASTMTILKLRKQPKSEEPGPWIIATVAYVFTCLSLTGTPFGILYVRPIYGLVIDAALVMAILYFRKNQKSYCKTFERPVSMK